MINPKIQLIHSAYSTNTPFIKPLKMFVNYSPIQLKKSITLDSMKKSLILFLLCLISFSSIGQSQSIYPAEFNKLWGFIDKDGVTVIKPKYTQHLDWFQDKSHYFMVDSADGTTNLSIFNPDGNLLMYLKDTGKGHLGHINGTRDNMFIIDIKNDLLRKAGKDTIVNYQKYKKLSYYSLVGYQREDSIAKFRGQYQLFYKFGNRKKLGSIKYLGSNLFMVNQGGFTVADYHPGSYTRLGCVIEDIKPHYMNHKVVGGRWTIVNKSFDTIYSSESLKYSNVKTIQGHYPKRINYPKYLSLLYIKERTNEDSVNNYIFLNRKGEKVYEEQFKNASIRTEQSEHFIAVKFKDQYYKTTKVILFDFLGNCLDTLEDFTRSFEQYATYKNGKWKLFKINGTLISQNYLITDQNIHLTNSDKVWWNNSDSTVVIFNFKNTLYSTFPGKRVQLCKGDYCVGEQVFAKNVREYYLYDTKNNKIPYTSNYSISFRPINTYSEISLKNEWYNVFHSKDTLKGYNGIERAFKTDGFYLYTYRYKYIFDTLFKPIYINKKEIRASTNGFQILSRDRYLKRNRELLFNEEIIIKNLVEHLFLYSLPSINLTVFKSEDYFYIHSKLTNKFTKIHARYGNKIKQVGELLKINIYFEDQWVYLNREGQIVYNSNPNRDLKHSNVSFAKFKRTHNK